MDTGLNWSDIIARLSENAGLIKHGETGVILKIHEGKIVHVTYSVTETSRGPGGMIAGANFACCNSGEKALKTLQDVREGP